MLCRNGCTHGANEAKVQMTKVGLCADSNGDLLGLICNFIGCCLLTCIGRKLLLVAWLKNDLHIK